ncbi:MAG: tetratricopeptide repeat protein [Gammaproteobacteria bacterium]
MSVVDASELLRRSLRAHEAGDLAAAAAGYRDVLAADPGQIDATHYLGMVAYQKGDSESALNLVGKAASARPDDPSILANYGLVLNAANRLDDASRALEQSLARSEKQPEAWFNLALTRLAQGQLDNAIECHRKAILVAPGHRRARLELARLLMLSERTPEARKILEDGYRLDPEDHALLLELGKVRELSSDIDAAVMAYQVVLDSDDQLRGKALTRLSTLMRRNGRPASALVAARSAIWADPDDHDAHRGLGQCLKELGRLRDAALSFRRAHTILRRPGSKEGMDRQSFTRTSKAKLLHDIQQFEYLIEKGEDEQHLRPLIRDHQALLSTMPEQLGNGQVVPIPGPLLQRVAPYYNRCHNYVDSPRLDGPAISPDLDKDTIEKNYYDNDPGYTWVDQVLTQPALEGLRRHCLESTIWYDFEHANGYSGAYLQEGLNCPLIIQIAEELPRAFPEIFADHVLMQLWAYKYGSNRAGINMHADFAAVNVNFWITPNESNLDPESGGLVLWDKEAPPEWGVDEYNTDNPAQQQRMRDYLEEAGARKIVVPHRQNRFLIFNSDLFHKTDDIVFADGYENRRINITMLYGTRDANKRGRQS